MIQAALFHKHASRVLLNLKMRSLGIFFNAAALGRIKIYIITQLVMSI